MGDAVPQAMAPGMEGAGLAPSLSPQRQHQEILATWRCRPTRRRRLGLPAKKRKKNSSGARRAVRLSKCPWDGGGGLGAGGPTPHDLDVPSDGPHLRFLSFLGLGWGRRVSNSIFICSPRFPRT